MTDTDHRVFYLKGRYTVVASDLGSDFDLGCGIDFIRQNNNMLGKVLWFVIFTHLVLILKTADLITV